ncbi:uncharacterized protein STEHIDRAFT_159302 [Stereum hirsutum FP-91666 SS1]|uniref:uncharacterized protein n=1 Tax=Stereum hirsutum (strain FP-91666) TaxID=721885 RepID=UPI000444A76B|nr:uncharacterized protein STEHIDRAFT_159302 [Stereum hirsutum FP-91666 SS1]EIM84639.1 hypothetical protein STEHIDRAFT_159302 [Stereum hirsutum FP-91666 SS1]
MTSSQFRTGLSLLRSPAVSHPGAPKRRRLSRSMEFQPYRHPKNLSFPLDIISSSATSSYSVRFFRINSGPHVLLRLQLTSLSAFNSVGTSPRQTVIPFTTTQPSDIRNPRPQRMQLALQNTPRTSSNCASSRVNPTLFAAPTSISYPPDQYSVLESSSTSVYPPLLAISSTPP